MIPQVSIIIPFYNCAYVNQALDSALAQTYPNIEILVVDDGSFLHVEKLDPYKDKIRYFKKENGGTATALNVGIQHAKGDFISWLSSDDLFVPEKTAKQAAFLAASPADVCFSNYDIIDEFGNVTLPSACTHPMTERNVYEAFMFGNPINGCTVMFKKDVFQKVGYFDHNYRYTQDYEMWFRLISKGISIQYLHEVLVKFRKHGESGTIKHQAEMTNEISMLESYYRPLVLQRLLSN
ncbi:glycosyltransferase [Metabacillus sp. GX 13764]|uniref:glycosyltransferase n=1 Tax=Metabacillus kandeliae TaxID=2900151 RepID=UPI001E4381E6|nr:glycosyltransferase [Metabacillus kandeliae]MCD7032639.1 glycosyltransferase [Metabacillus kandeliae]